MKEFVA